MYDFSLIEKNSGIEYFVEVYNITYPEERRELAKKLEEFYTRSDLELKKREDHYSEKTGAILVHIEWIRVIKKKVSPYSSELVERGELVCPG